MKNEKILRDGHIHSPYCPHGTNDTFEMYVEKALKEGLEEMTFTEHMSFSVYFSDDIKFLDECLMTSPPLMIPTNAPLCSSGSFFICFLAKIAELLKNWSDEECEVFGQLLKKYNRSIIDILEWFSLKIKKIKSL